MIPREQDPSGSGKAGLGEDGEFQERSPVSDGFQFPVEGEAMFRRTNGMRAIDDRRLEPEERRLQGGNEGREDEGDRCPSSTRRHRVRNPAQRCRRAQPGQDAEGKVIGGRHLARDANRREARHDI